MVTRSSKDHRGRFAMRAVADQCSVRSHMIRAGARALFIDVGS
jgi:hypothetical protein